ncbi:MAG: PKD domain-containing protein [Mariprofundaceae bacterium]
MKFQFIRFSVVAVFTMLLGLSSALAQINQPPVVDAGGDVTMILGTGTILGGSATDPEGDPIGSYIWSIVSQPTGSTALIEPPNAASPGFDADTLGDYSLAFQACDAASCSLVGFATVSVVLNQPPVAIASADVTSGTAPLTVHFDGAQSFDPEGGTLIFDWTFGDFMPAVNIQSPAHTFANPGTYTSVVAVVDNSGQLTFDTLLITVTSPVNRAPVANPTATPNTGAAPLTVAFNANASDADGDGLTYDWSFDDAGSLDNSSTAANPAHTYNGSGTFVAWLTVSDGSDSVTHSMTIVVDNPSLPGLGFSVKSAKLKLKKHGTKSKIKIKGDFTPTMLANGDVIALIFANREIFAVPFSSFVSAGSDDEEDDSDDEGLDDDDNPFKFKLKMGKTKVELDILKGRIEMKRKNMDLAGFDPTGGTVVELHIGNSVSVETIQLSGEDDEFEYKRDEAPHHPE